MPNEFDPLAELDRLLLRKQAEGAQGPAARELAKLLSSYPETITAYIDHCEMEAMLRESFGLLNLPDSDRVVAVELPKSPATQLSRTQSEPRQPTRAHGNLVRVVSIVAALAATVLLAFWIDRQSRAPDVEFQPAIPSPNSVAESTPSLPTLEREAAEPLASIHQSIGVTLYEAETGPLQVALGNRIGSGDFELRQGILELLFENGAVVILQAPAGFKMQDENHILVSQGRLTVRCETSESKGFSVETPSGVATDLGTEFAVHVSPSGKSDDEFHVFSGKVLLRPKADDRPRQLPLKEGQASRLDHRTATPAGIDVDYQRFIRGFHGDSDAYRDAVLQLQPVTYFPMAPNEDGRTIPNALLDQPEAVVQSSSAQSQAAEHLCWSSGFNGGTSLNMDGVHSATYAVVEDFPKATGNETAVVAWVYAESRVRWGSIAKNWQHGAQPFRRGQFHFGLHLDSGALGAQINDNDDVEQTVFEDIPLPLFEWHHVAMVVDETDLRLYRNGRQVAACPCNGLNGNPQIKPLAIGTKLGNQSLAPAVRHNGFWDGCIDHVAVFNKALTSEQIRRLYEVGTSSMESYRHSSR